VTASYTSTASTEEVREHYRRLFEAHGLPFLPITDLGITTIQGSAGCDLTVTVRGHGAGTAVEVTCTERNADTGVVTLPGSGGTPNSGPSYRTVTTPAVPSQALDRHRELVAAMGIHRQYQDAPAPPLVWPDWLSGVDGARLRPQRGVDQSHNDTLQVEYRTTAPMTKVFAFYKDLLNANGYSVYSSQLSTGQTSSGVQQNAGGHVEGAAYPDGTPGPHTEILVNFSRFYLNESIRVRVKFTTYAFQAPKTQRP
jgi:hypothetical protein